MADTVAPSIRYSPKPLDHYRGTDAAPGPGRDGRVDRIEVWNLAFLSYPYECGGQPSDPGFLTHVRRTCQVSLTTRQPDLTFGAVQGKGPLFGSLLLKPAPWLALWLQRNPDVVKCLPLFQMYGVEWLHQVYQRQRICQTHEHLIAEPFQLMDVSSARSHIQRIMRM